MCIHEHINGENIIYNIFKLHVLRTTVDILRAPWAVPVSYFVARQSIIKHVMFESQYLQNRSHSYICIIGNAQFIGNINTGRY